MNTISRRVITAEGARRVLAAAVAHAESQDLAMCVAVADAAGNLVTYLRMDGAPLLSARLAQDKAYTVAAFNGMPTHEWWAAIKDDPALRAGITKTDRLVVFGGGVPLVVEGEVVGAIGVSGGTVDEDRNVAEAGAAAFGSALANTGR